MEDALGAKFRHLNSPTDPLFWPALEFYIESFPREEREPLAKVAAVASGDPDFCTGDQRRVHFLIAEVDGELAGIRYFSYHSKARLGFLIYLAVERRFRRKGIGERLVQFGKAQCLEDARAMGSGLDAIVFECERPELAKDEEDRRVRDARINYFLRRGAQIVSKDYHQPALGPSTAAVPLYLMAYAQSEKVDWPEVIVQFHRDVLGYEADSPEEREALKAASL